MQSISSYSAIGALTVALGAGAVGGLLVMGSAAQPDAIPPATVELHPVSADETASPEPSASADPAALAPVESSAPVTIVKTVEVPVPSSNESAEQAADRASVEADRARAEADRAEQVATKVETPPAPAPKPAPTPDCVAPERRAQVVRHKEGGQTQINFECVDGKWVEAGRIESAPPEQRKPVEEAPASGQPVAKAPGESSGGATGGTLTGTPSKG